MFGQAQASTSVNQTACPTQPVETIGEIVTHLKELANLIAQHSYALSCAIGGPVPVSGAKSNEAAVSLPEYLRQLRTSLAESSEDLGRVRTLLGC